MAVDYNKYLTDEQKANILTQRLQQFASEAYQHEINKKFAVEKNDTELVEKSQQAIDTINEAIVLHETELNALNLLAPTPVEEIATDIVEEVTPTE